MGKEGGKITRVDFRTKQIHHPKNINRLTLSSHHSRYIQLFIRSILAGFLIWVGISANDFILTTLFMGLGILTILLSISNIIREEIENSDTQD